MRHDPSVAVSFCHTCGLLQRVGVKDRATALRACHMCGLQRWEIVPVRHDNRVAQATFTEVVVVVCGLLLLAAG